MANMGDTGNGTTFVLATSALSLAIKTIAIGETVIDMLDVSTLATTDFMIEIASDLKQAPEVTATFVFDTSIDGATVGGAAETGTLTLPLRTGEQTAANFAGTGVITAFKLPDTENGTVQEGQLKFKYDGEAGPTYTKSVPTP